MGVTNTKLGTDISAAILAGTLPNARFPATLPALNGSNLTNLDAGKILQINIFSTVSASSTLNYMLRRLKFLACAYTTSLQVVYFD